MAGINFGEDQRAHFLNTYFHVAISIQFSAFSEFKRVLGQNGKLKGECWDIIEMVREFLRTVAF
jgi:hypothetical protein